MRPETDPAVIDETPRPALYAARGFWFSEPLDSRHYRCQWHAVEVELDALPRGSQVALSTYSGAGHADALHIQPGQWDDCGGQTGDMRDGPVSFTALVRSRPGQFLRLRLELTGDGRRSPQVRRLKVIYPRDAYLRYLPAEFQRDEPSRLFLEHYLALVQTEWDAIEARVADFAALADPRAVADEQLPFLAAWLGLPLEGEWSAEQQRRLLIAAPSIMARRGTAAGLRAYLRVYLENMTGLTAAQQGAYPVIIEGFRQRARATLPAGDGLAAGLPLWSPAAVGRLQLDVFATEGEVALIATNDPARDLYHAHAHRFTVVVPAAWVRDAAAERLLRRAIDAEKPAHTAYELRLLPSRLVVGGQSTVGVDTIVGRRPPPRLNRAALGESALPGPDTAAPGVRLPGLRLG